MLGSNFPEIRTSAIQDIIRLAREKYVHPETGEKIASQIEAKLEDGAYDDITQGSDLAFRLTMDLQSISSDHHWSVVFDPKGAAVQVNPESEADKARKSRYLETARKTNYGFERVEHLKGNIGYIDLRRFEPSEYGGETAVAAMNFIANCDALIIDLRQNHGGHPSMVQLIASYLYDPEPRHINTFYYRPTNDTHQFWTFPHVPGKRRPDILVYVLISGATGSAAEGFSYFLKCMDRATLIGETTIGAAHPANDEIVQGDFVVSLPYGRSISPITGSNWEGAGVEPHIMVPAEEALKTAHLHAMEQLAGKCQNEDQRNELKWMVEIVASDYSPVVLDEADLSPCVGEFGKRKFMVKNGWLFYGHMDSSEDWKLLPMTKTRFRLDEDMKFEFVLGKDGKASKVKISYRDGSANVISNRTG
jgi:hypothetical protein